MDLNKRYICVFVRQNMFPDHQMVHGFHLGYLSGRAADGFCQKRHQLTGHPIVLVFGEPDEAAMVAKAEELKKLGIEFIEWCDPDSKPEDDDFGLAGIVTEPITKTQRNKLPHWNQWGRNKNTRLRTETAPEESKTRTGE